MVRKQDKTVLKFNKIDKHNWVGGICASVESEPTLDVVKMNACIPGYNRKNECTQDTWLEKAGTLHSKKNTHRSSVRDARVSCSSLPCEHWQVCPSLA